MNIAILGGYGNAGRLIARYLAPRTPAAITLLGRDGQKAREAASDLSRETGRDVRGGRADASNNADLAPVLRAADVLVVAASSTASVRTVAEAALETQTDYFDVQLSSPAKIAALRRLEPALVAQRRCFITDGGYHPGVPGAMVRYAHRHVPRLERAHVGGAFTLDWSARSFSEATLAEFVAELKDFDPSAFVGGRWVRRWTTTRAFDFGPPFGTKRCAPMLFEEMRSLPEQIPTLRETGFFIAGFGPLVDYLVMPLCFAWLAVAPRRADAVAKLFHWGLCHGAGSSDGAVLVLDAAGADEDGATLRMRLAHDDPYVLTAVPAVACLLQYLEGDRKPGLWTQAHFVDPDRFFDDLRAMGVSVEVTPPVPAGVG